MGLFITWVKQTLPGWLRLSGKGDIPARQAAEGSALCLARQRLAAGTRACQCCEAPRRHRIIQGMISGRMTHLGGRTLAGLVTTPGEGREESSPWVAELAGLSRVNGRAAVQVVISSARQDQVLRSVVK